MGIRVKVGSSPKIKVKTRISTPDSITSIDNIDIENIKDGYVLMYDESEQRYTFVDPDKVLDKATITNDGLPELFLDTLDNDLDNRIDLDGGEF
jgi:hypothetical protein